MSRKLKLYFCYLPFIFFSNFSYAQNRIVVNSSYGSVQITNDDLGISHDLRPYVFQILTSDSRIPFVLVESIQFQDGTSCVSRNCFDFPESISDLWSTHKQHGVSTIFSFDKPVLRIELRMSALLRSENDSSINFPNIVYEAGQCDLDTTGTRLIAETTLDNATGLIQSIFAVLHNGTLETICENY